MKMDLKLITFTLDNTQFLVDAEADEQAIKYANEANKLAGGLDEYDFDNPEAGDYVVEEVDFPLLSEIIQRNDWLVFKNYNKAIIYWD